VRLWRTVVVPKIAGSKIYAAFLKLPLIGKIASVAQKLDVGAHS
jgi:hypothetical protein